MEQIDKTKELETKDIRQLLWKYALPAVISQIIASLYNIADRIFIGQGVGPLAIAGLAITTLIKIAAFKMAHLRKILEYLWFNSIKVVFEYFIGHPFVYFLHSEQQPRYIIV